MSSKHMQPGIPEHRTPDRPGHDEADQALLHGIGELARSELDGHSSLEQHRAARAALLATVGGHRASQSSEVRKVRRLQPLALKLGLAAAFAAALFAIAFFVVRAPSRPLTFVIGGSVSANESTVRAGNEEVHVRFDDGTDIAFEPGSSGRIADVTPHGARVILAEGRAHFDVRHREGSAWSVEAGSYVVRVTGTEFDLDWSPAKSSLRVVMQRGSVAVEGAKSPVPALVGGNMLDVDATGSIMIRSAVALGPAKAAAPEVVDSAAGPAAIAPAAIAPAAIAPAASASANEPASSATPTLSLTSSASAPSVAIRWSRRVERGEYAEVVSEASATGIDSVLRTASLDDLVALSDASRYSGHGDISLSALTAIRSRFAQSQAAHTSAFLLGRMADDRGSFAEAIRLYDEYLANGGPFSGEALGRKMIALNRSGNASAARELARSYLVDHPEGTYAAFAKSLVEAP